MHPSFLKSKIFAFLDNRYPLDAGPEHPVGVLLPWQNG